MDALSLFLDKSLWLLLAPLVLFILVYASFSPWWKSPIGRIIMTQKASWILYLSLVLIAKQYKGEGWYESLRAGVYLLLLISFWAMTVEVIRVLWPNIKRRWQKYKANRCAKKKLK